MAEFSTGRETSGNMAISPGGPLDHMACDAEIARVNARAEAAEAALDRVTKLAETWAALAPPDDWGVTAIDTAVADAGRAILAAIRGTGDSGSKERVGNG